jgi:Sec7-like guanine-nucleotide exchange factor
VGFFFQRELTPENVPTILNPTQGLFGQKMTDFLAKPNHQKYLKPYFRVIHFVEAMRRGLSGPFFIPGETQHIEWTIQTLSDVYIEQNSTIFSHVNDSVVFEICFSDVQH